MLKRAKILNIICSVTISLVLVLILILGLVLGGVISFKNNKLVIKSVSDQKVYDGVPLTSESYEIVMGELEEGHTLEVGFSGIQAYAGQSQNTFYVTIKDELGMDVTGDYDLTLEYGTLEVLRKPVKIIAGSAQKLYDGTPLTCDSWSYSPQSALLHNHRLEVEVVGEITEVGMVMNVIGSAIVYNESGKDVTSNYNISLEYGTLMVIGEGGFGGMIGGGGGLNLGGMISGNKLPGQGADIVCYQLRNEKDDSVYLKLKSFGDYAGNKWLDAEEYTRLISGEYSADYLTGSAMSQSHARLEILSLNGQYALPYYLRRTYSLQYTPTLSDVYYVGNTDDVYAVYYGKYTDDRSLSLPMELGDYEREYRDFVYGQYCNIDVKTFEFMQGLIAENNFYGSDMTTVLAVAEYIQNSAKYNLYYDTALDSEENIAIAFLSEYKEGICQHYATAATMLYRAMGIPARYTVGFVGDTVAGEWVDVTAENAHAWVEIYLDGIGWIQVEVTGGGPGGGGSGGGPGGGSGGGSGGGNSNELKAELAPVYVDMLYDGTTLYAPQMVTGFSKYEKLGYKLSVTVSGSRTEPGKSVSEITSYEIFDPDGNVVTDQFKIKLGKGVVHVYLSEVVFSSRSQTKEYNGTPLMTDIKGCRFIKGHFVHENVVYEIKSSTTLESVGTKAADFTVKLTADGEDITDLYKITKIRGTLEITPISITVKADDAWKEYDGTPLISNGYTITEGSLAEGDYVYSCIIRIEQERIEVGRSECIPDEIVICNGKGQDVTRNYSIIYEEGMLRVYPAAKG